MGVSAGTCRGCYGRNGGAAATEDVTACSRAAPGPWGVSLRGACCSTNSGASVAEDVTAGSSGEEAESESKSKWTKFDGKELEEPIVQGWVRVLDSRYLVHLSRGTVLRRRQDMPDAAYLSLEQLKDLGVYKKDVGHSVTDEQIWLPLVILSYPWLTPAHPDPQGDTLATLVEALEKLERPHGVIIDFTALPQVPRDASEDAAFRSGLKSLNLFYTHPYVLVFKVTEFPADYPAAAKYNLGGAFTPVQYNQRGWCYAESCMAALGSKPKLVCDISKAHLITSVLGSGASRTPPPLSPESFNLKLSTKTFTQAKTDTERVQRLYSGAFDLRIQTATSLRFACLGWGAAEVRDLAKVLESNTGMERLELSDNELGSEGASAVVEVLRTHSLQVLGLRQCQLGAGAAAEIAEALKVNCDLTALNLGKNTMGTEGVVALSEALRVNSTLAKLNLDANDITEEGAVALGEALKVNSALTTLDLEWNDIGKAGAVSISEALTVSSTLTTLSLVGNPIGDEGAAALAGALKVNGTLATLTLRRNQIGKEGAVALAEALKVNSKLSSLFLWRNQMGTQGAVALGEALKVNRGLVRLKLQGNKILDEGAVALAEALKVNGALATLSLDSNDIGAQGAAALADALKINKTLKTLELLGNHVGKEGAVALGEALQRLNSALTTLNLSGNDIGEAGAAALGEALMVSDTLTTLNLRRNGIGKEGAVVLGEALKIRLRVSSTLKSVDLRFNDLGVEGAAALAAFEKIVTR